MPTYVYRFTETGETIEVQQSFSDDTLTEAVHPGTGRTMAVKKVFQPVGVTFKGDGFYKTDSRASKGSGGTSTSDASSDAGSSPASANEPSSGSSGSSSSTESTGSTGSTASSSDA